MKRKSDEEIGESLKGVKCKQEGRYNEEPNTYLSLMWVQFDSVFLSLALLPVAIEHK